mgnify:FL=1
MAQCDDYRSAVCSSSLKGSLKNLYSHCFVLVVVLGTDLSVISKSACFTIRLNKFTSNSPITKLAHTFYGYQ